MSIYGIGTDIVTITRMAELYSRHGERALKKMLAAEEWPLCRQSADPARYLAKRFAAKEALAKALGTGIRAPVLLSSIAVINDALGKPTFRFSAQLAEYMQALELNAHLSLSDERDTAVAFVVLEQS
ncbi:MAG TPA: holo-ACP synthase [Rhodocyclaceae bacterium]|nr:holo-ACP synthase [Rhodocyclaceae bacterium]